MAETILFVDDLLHVSKGAPVSSSSTTDPGYFRDNVFDANLSSAWKGVDSTTGAVYVQRDVGSTSYFGGLGAVVYVAIAYDSRDNEQDTIKLTTDATDDPAMPAQNVEVTFTLVKNGTGPVCHWASFAHTSKRHWRLFLNAGERSEPTGSKVPRIYRWAMYKPAGVYNIDTEYDQDAIDAGAFVLKSKVAKMESASGVVLTNKYGSTDQEVEVAFRPASQELFTDMTNAMASLDNEHVPIFMQYGGLRNAGTADFFMVRQSGGVWKAQRNYKNNYDTVIPFATEPWN